MKDCRFCQWGGCGVLKCGGVGNREARPQVLMKLEDVRVKECYLLNWNLNDNLLHNSKKLFWTLFKYLMFVIGLFNRISIGNFRFLYQCSGAWNDVASIRDAIWLAVTCSIWFSILHYLETVLFLHTIENNPCGKVDEPQSFSPRQVTAFKCLLCWICWLIDCLWNSISTNDRGALKPWIFLNDVINIIK